MVQYYSHFSADPHYNMAFDEWMFGKALSEAGSRFLRLYTWSRPAITFGFNQTYERAFDHSRLGDVPAIRRVTGGRALLHDPSELTYSLAINTDGNAGAALVGAGSQLSAGIGQALVDFLKSIDIQCECVRRSSSQNSHPAFFHKAPCFASVARYEIVQGNRKVVASAQRCLERTVFQHGSIKVSGVASHPAVSLNATGTPAGDNLKPIIENAFRYMEQRFMAAFQLWSGGPIIASDLSESDRTGLLEREALVRNNCAARRDIFKQK